MPFRTLTLSVLIAGLALAAPAAPLTVKAPKAAAAPTIDGDMGDACWSNAAVLTPFVDYKTGTPAQMPTTARIAYNDQALYLSITCTEPQTDKLVAKVVPDRPAGEAFPVSRDDCVEVFIVPGQPTAYYHFVVNPINTRLDQRNWGYPREQDNHWDGDWTSAARVVTGQAWNVEMAIPWHNFAADLGNGQWRINVCRGKRTPPAEFSSFSPVDGNFHQPDRFALLEKPAVNLAPLTGLSLADVAVPRYTVEGKGYAYECTGQIVSKAADERRLLMELTDRPADGPATTVTQPLTIAAHGSQPLTIKVPFAALGPRTLQIRLRNAADNRPVLVNAYAENLFPRLLTAYVDRNYYTTETEVRAIFSLNVAAAPAVFTAAAEITPEKEPARRQETPIQTPRRTVIAFPLAEIPLGTNAARLLVRDQAGRTIAEERLIVRREKPAPAPIQEVKVDHDRMKVLVDGQPFFPICMYAPPTNMYAEIVAAGFNTIIRWGGKHGVALLKDPEPEKRRWITDYLDQAQTAGLKVIEWPTCFMSKNASYASPTFLVDWYDFVSNELPYVVRTAATHPALLAYYGPDEPGSSGPKDRTYWEPCKVYSDVMRQLDPYHPNYFLFCAYGSPEWPDVYDISGRDYYSIGYGYPMISVYKAALRDAQTTHKFRVPNWHVPLLEVCSATKNYISGPMQIAQGYLSVIAGVDGVLWWIWPPRYQDNWEALKQLGREFKVLTPILTERTPAQDIRYAQRGTEDSIKVLVKNHAGKTYLLACNAGANAVKAAFQLPNSLTGPVRVWFENDRAPALRDGALTDDFELLSRHVYELNGVWPEDGVLTLDLQVQGQAAAAAEEIADPTRSNLIQDPGFETPDFWRFDSGDAKTKTVTGGLITATKHSGRQGAQINRPHAEGQSAYSGWIIELKPNTTYEFGGWCSTVGGRGSLYLQGPYPDGTYIRDETTLTVPDRAGWARVMTRFKTRDKALKVTPVCSYSGGPGTAWFDDLFLYEAGVSMNLARNSGFERDNLPGWPLDWNPMYSIVEKAGFIGDPDGVWTPDEKVVFEGKRSMRVRKDSTLYEKTHPGIHQYRLMLTEGTYTLSAYLKADPPGAKVRMGLLWTQFKDITISGEWKRYTLKAVIKQPGESFICFDLMTPGTLWADAVQLERGEPATDYAPGP